MNRQIYILLLTFAVLGASALTPCVVAAAFAPAQRQTGEAPTPTPTMATPQGLLQSTLQPFIVHVVKAGETLSQIAARYGVTIDQIVKSNRLHNPNYLAIGQRLLIFTDAAMVAVTPTAIPTANARAIAMTTQDEVVCPNAVRSIPLALPSDPMRMVLVDDQLFFVADGALYQLALSAIGGTAPVVPTNLMPPARMIGEYVIQELVYLTVDESNGDLLLLDKTNDIYRYSLAQAWAMAFPATPVPDQFPDPQYLAIQGDATGVYALDADLSRIWVLRPGDTVPQVYLRNAQLLTGTDMVLISKTEVGPTFVVLRRDGSLMRFGQAQAQYVADAAPRGGQQPWPTELLSADGTLYAVDGEARQIIGVDSQSGQVVRQMTFRLPNLQRLRSVIVQAPMVYALAGPNLYVADLQKPQECPAVAYDNNYYFAGSNLLTVLADFALPFPNTILPERPRSYPGARRLYRYGIHEGLDLYALDATGLHVGSPVFNVADGTVVRADTAYVEPSPAAYEAAITQSATEHRTPLLLIDHFLGRQVWIAHRPGVESHYSHLQAIAPGLAAGQSVTQGAEVGAVGVSGTSAGAYGTTDGAHLHFELWINGRYLGQGLSLYETMRLWQVVFEQ